MAITHSTRAWVLCPAGRRHTLTTHLACLRLTSNIARALPQSAAIRSHQPGRCGYLRAPAAVRNPAAGRWRRVREASYLLSYASPCLKLKLALVVLNVLRALPQSAAIRSHQPGRCGYLRAPAAVRNPASDRLCVYLRDCPTFEATRGKCPREIVSAWDLTLGKAQHI